MLALEPRLLDCAQTLTRDAGEAQTLVRQTFKLAKDRNYGLAEGGDAQAWLFRLLRQRFYSVERDRDYRRDKRGPLAGYGSVRQVAVPGRDGEEEPR